MNTGESPFYLAVNHNENGKKWFKNQPVGKNKLSVMMKTMANNAGLVGKKTNQSLRKTLCTKLLHSGVAPTTIMQLSGHKNVNSVNNYAVASMDQQREMCELLQNVPKTSLSSKCTSSTLSRRDVVGSKEIAPVQNSTVPRSSGDCQNLATGMFSGANITGGTFNISFQISSQSSSQVISPPRKYRRILRITDDDDDSV
ncbi:uncharacterized protein LOC117318372 [Pecten maximus]|uniref:uncharacterized protein LOC117318372 n=1 Tax=Pecten maximus TaxID=6579 RepID=UPI001458C1A3|nr:uncharacterized protein LOC117318372 [Pecten maximus]